jgi:hypothetical protein
VVALSVLFSHREPVALFLLVEALEWLSVGRTLFGGQPHLLAHYLGSAAVVRLGVGEVEWGVKLGVEWGVVGGGGGGSVDGAGAAALETGHPLVALLELHPGVDEQVLALEQQEGLQRVDRLQQLALIHLHL